ncbi:MAG: hypothetical protein MI922_01405, partial [Bacteroidales bacterium]|nr:hypothetical protein [Bacteroidales bacterium]
MKIYPKEDAVKLPFELEAYRLLEHKPLELVQLILKAKESVEVHQNPLDIVFYVAAGDLVTFDPADPWNLTEINRYTTNKEPFRVVDVD